MNRCKWENQDGSRCGSYALNIRPCGDLCDVHYWQAIAEQLAGVLRGLEWEEELNPKSDIKYCPACLRYLSYGHEDDCKLDAALSTFYAAKGDVK